MTRRVLTATGWLLVVGVGVSACTAEGASPAVAPSTPAAAPSVGTWLLPPAPPRQPGEVTLPVLEDDGYADAVATFGGPDQVYTAVAADARVARIALADCHRWTTGELHPELRTLVTPSFLAEVEAELDRPPGTVPSLLSHLPEDDGNGHTLASDVRAGCDDSAPLRVSPNSRGDGQRVLLAHVDRSRDTPALVVTGSFVTEVALGGSEVSAGQDWVFTSVPTAVGWQLADAESNGNVNWALPLPD